jgi:hypothetical protein
MSIDDIFALVCLEQLTHALRIGCVEGPDIDAGKDAHEVDLPPAIPPDLGDCCSARTNREALLLDGSQQLTDAAVTPVHCDQGSCVEDDTHATSASSSTSAR